ncbi:MAG: cell division protein ZapA [candidate division FCPU426 bacterium]
MSEERPSVKVTIFGSEYAIRGEADDNYIFTLARYLDEKMREISENTHLTSPLKISILAGINLADEIFRLRAHRAEPAGSGSSGKPESAQNLPPVIDPDALAALSQHIQAALAEEDLS